MIFSRNEDTPTAGDGGARPLLEGGHVDGYQPNTPPRVADLPPALAAQVARERFARQGFGANPVVRGFWFVPCDDGCTEGIFLLPGDKPWVCVRCRGTGYVPLAMVDDPADVAIAMGRDLVLLDDAARAARQQQHDEPDLGVYEPEWDEPEWCEYEYDDRAEQRADEARERRFD